MNRLELEQKSDRSENVDDSKSCLGIGEGFPAAKRLHKSYFSTWDKTPPNELVKEDHLANLEVLDVLYKQNIPALQHPSVALFLEES